MKNLILYCCICAIGGLLFGLDQGNFNGIQMKQTFVHDFCFMQELPTVNCNEIDLENQPAAYRTFKALATSLIYLGSAIGTVLGFFLTRRFGRQRCIVIGSLLGVVGTLWVMSSSEHGTFLLGRIINGVGTGLLMYCLPIYISEIATKSNRGMLGTLIQVFIALGLLAGFAGNMLTHSWRVVIGVPIAPGLILLSASLYLPRSPRWLLRKGKYFEAKEALVRIRGTPDVYDELKEMTNSAVVAWEKSESFMDLSRQSQTCIELLSPTLRRRFAVAILLQWCQQYTGINAIFSYSSQIFSEAGVANPMHSTAILCAIGLVATLIGMAFIERSRKNLLTSGNVIMAISFIISASLLYSNLVTNVFGTIHIILLCIFTIGFAIGWGPVPWIIPSEILPMSVKEQGVAFAVTQQWVANFSVTFLVPFMIPAMGIAGMFLFFAGMNILSFIFVYLWVPETKGKSLEEIERMFSTTKLSSSSLYTDIIIDTKGKKPFSISIPL